MKNRGVVSFTHDTGTGGSFLCQLLTDALRLSSWFEFKKLYVPVGSHKIQFPSVRDNVPSGFLSSTLLRSKLTPFQKILFYQLSTACATCETAISSFPTRERRCSR